MTDLFQDVDTTMVEVLERIESILRFSSTVKEFKSCTRSERRFPKASKTFDRDESVDEFHRRHF